MVNQHGQALLNVNNTLHLQRLVGNKAVAKLISARAEGTPTIQRADEMAGASRTALIDELERAAKEYYKRKAAKITKIPKIVEDFKKDGKLKVILGSGRVTVNRRFFSVKLAALKRGQRITVLGLKGSWCRVKTDDGKLGWTPSILFIPPPGMDKFSSAPLPPGPKLREFILGGRG